MMRNLKAEIAPTDHARKQEILKTWNKLKTTAKSSTDLESWLRDWHVTYDDGVSLAIPDMIDGVRPHHDFLTAIWSIAPSFADVKETELLDDEAPWTFKELLRAHSEWKKLIQEEGIEVELSTPDNHDQNGSAERTGGVIIHRAASMRIGANLPQKLHPEICTAAGYILNRS
ncbi:hypothetical protein EG329_002501 [Mollisiaceae sp. DMI_Dod_QoI]|nr:hypothetical protein EG329_002501 [Helotiales sp. DMI_Dod_QoI]